MVCTHFTTRKRPLQYLFSNFSKHLPTHHSRARALGPAPTCACTSTHVCTHSHVPSMTSATGAIRRVAIIVTTANKFGAVMCFPREAPSQRWVGNGGQPQVGEGWGVKSVNYLDRCTHALTHVYTHANLHIHMDPSTHSPMASVESTTR